MSAERSYLIHPARAEGKLVICAEGLSFWGGVDPASGRVIDAHHPVHGAELAGKIVVMPTSRGSCSGSGVLLQLALNGCAPAALVFREDEEILTLGALVASRMFDREIGVVRLSGSDFDALGGQKSAKLEDGELIFGARSIDLHPISGSELELSRDDQAKLRGDHGKPIALAMEIICTMAATQGAKRLITVTRAHIDGCIYAHEANLIFAEAMAKMGAKVVIPTTMNAISVDRENWTNQGVPRDFGQAASRLADAYVGMGAQANFTCAPYQSSDPPQLGEAIGWSESNAVIFANSVLGARTTKHPDYLDLFLAMTGRAPETGVYLDENRRPAVVLDVEAPRGIDDAFWPVLGWVAGQLAPDRVPLLTGLETVEPSKDDLRALCAAFGTTSAAPLLHVAGVTPEAGLAPVDGALALKITRDHLLAAWRGFNTGPEKVDLIALGSPHFSLAELRRFAALMTNTTCHSEVSVMITLSRATYAQAHAEGLVAQLKSADVQFYADLCWCSIVEPILPRKVKTLMTNSGKYAHYAPGLSQKTVRFGSLAQCAVAAQTGYAAGDLPEWLL